MTTGRAHLVEQGIVQQDFSGLHDAAETLRAIGEARAFMETLPRDGSVLVLTDVTGSSFNQEVVDAMRELAEHHRPWVRASALIGLSPLMRVIYRAIVALTRREIRVCGSRIEAVSYLLARAAKPASGVSGPSSGPGASPRKP